MGYRIVELIARCGLDSGKRQSVNTMGPISVPTAVTATVPTFSSIQAMQSRLAKPKILVTRKDILTPRTTEYCTFEWPELYVPLLRVAHHGSYIKTTMSFACDLHSHNTATTLSTQSQSKLTPQHDLSFSTICPFTNVVEHPTLRCQRPEYRQCADAGNRTPLC